MSCARGVVGAGVVLAVALSGCATTIVEPASCCDWARLGTRAESFTFDTRSAVGAQAVLDIVASTTAATIEATTACRELARGFGATPEELAPLDAEADPIARLRRACSLASGVLDRNDAARAIHAAAAACELSISAKTRCQAACARSGTCDVYAEPLACAGGSLSLRCGGACRPKPGAPLACVGVCTGACLGTCVAAPGRAVACRGACDGTCSAVAVDGTCAGTCDGVCVASAGALAAPCDGACDGRCDGSCVGTRDVPVMCDGTCDANVEPLACRDGRLEGGCTTDAACNAACDASITATASCSPPATTVTVADPKLRVILQTHLETILTLAQRFALMQRATGPFRAGIDAVVESIGGNCRRPLVALAATASDDVEAVASVTADLSTRFVR